MYVEEIISRLKKLYPKGYFQINRDPYYLLISTVLSQRTRDEVTITTTQKRFSVFDNGSIHSNVTGSSSIKSCFITEEHHGPTETITDVFSICFCIGIPSPSGTK